MVWQSHHLANVHCSCLIIFKLFGHQNQAKEYNSLHVLHITVADVALFKQITPLLSFSACTVQTLELWNIAARYQHVGHNGGHSLVANEDVDCPIDGYCLDNLHLRALF